MENKKREQLRIDLLMENKLSIDWEKYAIILEDKILETAKKLNQEFQCGWLYTGDGFKLNTGDEYYSVYKKDLFFIKKEYVERGIMYGSDYYHTRFKHIENAEKFILDCQEKKYSQYQIKHACIHAEIDICKIEKMYSFLQEKAI
jgi:hypothetical protein